MRFEPRQALPLESPFNRFVAAAIDDSLWFVAAGYILGYMPQSVYEDHPETVGILLIALASLWLNYFAFCESRWGRTVGKQVMGMRVLAEDGGKASFAACSIRNLLRPADYLIVGPVMIANTARRQRLGDKLGHTVVVSERPPTVPAPAATAVEADDSTPLTDREHVRLPEPPATGIAAPLSATASEPEDRGDGPRRLPEVNWNLRQTIWGMVGGLFLAAFVAPLVILPFDTDLSSLGAILGAQALLTAGLVGTALYVARQNDADGSFDLGATLSRLGWRRFQLKAIGQLLGTLFVYYVAAALVSIVVQPDQEDIGSQLGLDRGVWLASLAVFLICVVAPIAEETFFRGFFFAGLRRHLSRLPAALISGLVFGAVHAPTGPTAAIPLAILGTGLALLYERTGSIWPGIIAHALNNSLALAVG
ncbi:MAG: type II CAAX prenyl endopeptidase Rce1 family protein [Solirubrobacterales bacterium]